MTNKKEISELLNKALSNYQVVNMKVKSYHWNISGTEFFEMHEKFEEIYQDFNQRIDEIAERIKAIDAEEPYSCFSKYIKEITVNEEFNETDAKKCSKELLKDVSAIIDQEKSIIIKANSINDYGTEYLIKQYVFQNEKLLWMLKKYNS